MPNNADADKKIALATIARRYIQLGLSRPEVPSFPAQAESGEDPHIEEILALSVPLDSIPSRHILRKEFTGVADPIILLLPILRAMASGRQSSGKR